MPCQQPGRGWTHAIHISESLVVNDGVVAMSAMNTKSHTVACIGGTFDALHAGHKNYIRLAFKHADYVIIHLSSDCYAQKRKRYYVRSFETRTKRLRDFLTRIGIQQNHYELKKIDSQDELENALVYTNAQYAVIVREYEYMFQQINQKRLEQGKERISLIIKRRAPHLSSTAIYFPARVFDYIPIATANTIESNKLKSPNIPELIQVW